jgi:hypothetical protein
VQPSHAGSHGQSGEETGVAVDPPWNSALATDGWHPQVNGFASTSTHMQREVARLVQRLHLACLEALTPDRRRVRAAVDRRTRRAIASDLHSVLVLSIAQRPTAASGRVRLAPATAP